MSFVRKDSPEVPSPQFDELEIRRLRHLGRLLSTANAGGYVEIEPSSTAEDVPIGSIFYVKLPNSPSLCVVEENFLIPCDPLFLKKLAAGQDRRRGFDVGWACSAMGRRRTGDKNRVVRLRATCSFGGNKRYADKTSTTNPRVRKSKKCRCAAVISANPPGEPGSISNLLEEKAVEYSRQFPTFDDEFPGFVVVTKCMTRHTDHDPRVASGDISVPQLTSSIEAVADPRIATALETFMGLSTVRNSANVLRATRFLRRTVPDVIVPEIVVRNSLALLRRREGDAMSTQDLLFKLRENGKVEYFVVGRSENGVLDYIFFTPKGSRDVVHRCADVVSIDSTHHTTRYDYKTTSVIAIDSLGKSRCTSVCLALREDARTMSRMLADWALAMRRCNSKAPADLPCVVFTDDDCGLAGALSMAPKAEMRHHLLCIWHLVDKNVYAHTANVLEGGATNWPLFRLQFDNVRQSPTVEEFERLWEELLSRWFSSYLRPQKNARLYMQKYVYSKRERWAFAFFPTAPTLGSQSTQRSESFHALLKKSIAADSSLCNFVEHVVDLIDRQGYPEKRAADNINEIPTALDCCSRTSDLLRREARKHRLSPFAARMISQELETTTRMGVKFLDCQDGARQDGSNDHQNLALVDYVLPQSDAERASKTVVDINVAIAGAAESPLSWDGVLKSGMPQDACPCLFSSRFSLPCRHILAVSFHVCTLSASGSNLVGRLEKYTLPNCNERGISSPYNFMEYMVLHLTGHRWRLPGYPFSRSPNQEKPRESLVHVESESIEGPMLIKGCNKLIPFTSESGKHVDHHSDQEDESDFKAEMREWCEQASQGQPGYCRKDFSHVDSVESRRRSYGVVASLGRDLASLCSSSEGGGLICGRIARLLSQVIVDLSSISERLGHLGMAACIEEVMASASQAACSDLPSPNEPIVIRSSGNSFGVFNREDYRQHIQAAFRERDEKQTIRNLEWAQQSQSAWWKIARKTPGERMPSSVPAEVQSDESKRTALRRSRNALEEDSARDSEGSFATDAVGRTAHGPNSVNDERMDTLCRVSDMDTRNPPVRKRAKKNNAAAAAPHKSRQPRKSKKTRAERIPVSRRHDKNNKPLLAMSVKGPPSHNNFACPFCDQIKVQSVLFNVKQHVRAQHDLELESIKNSNFRELAARAAGRMLDKKLKVCQAEGKDFGTLNHRMAEGQGSVQCSTLSGFGNSAGNSSPSSSLKLNADTKNGFLQTEVISQKTVQAAVSGDTGILKTGTALRACVRRVVRSLRQPLLESEMMAVQKIEHSAVRRSGKSSVVEVTVCGIPVDSTDVSSMQKGCWFSDSVINAFVPAVIGRLPVARDSILFMNTHLSTVIDDTSRTRTWTKKAKIHQSDLIIVPYHHSGSKAMKALGGMHWSLVLVQVQKRIAFHVDPLHPQKEGVQIQAKNVVRWLNSACEASPYEEDKILSGTWSAVCGHAYAVTHKLPAQSNGDDCGVLVCLYAVHAAINAIVDGVTIYDFCPDQSPVNFRASIKNEILRRHSDVHRSERQKKEDATPRKRTITDVS